MWGGCKLASLKSTLKKHNVSLIEEKRLSCNKCGESWNIVIQSSGRLPKGYWKCPKKCNYQEREYKHSPEVRAYFAKRNREQKKRGV